MEIPSSHAGVIKELKIKLGDKVSKGTPVATLTATAGGAAAKSAQPAAHPRHLRSTAAPAAEGRRSANTVTCVCD